MTTNDREREHLIAALRKSSAIFDSPELQRTADLLEADAVEMARVNALVNDELLPRLHNSNVEIQALRAALLAVPIHDDDEASEAIRTAALAPRADEKENAK